MKQSFFLQCDTADQSHELICGIIPLE